MRVLHIFKTYLPDSFTGVERVIWEIAEGVRDFGIESDVLSLTTAANREPLSVGNHTVYRAKRDIYLASTGLSWSVFQKFHSLSRRADVIHYHFPWPLMDLLDFIRPRMAPSVVTYHSDIVRQKHLLWAYRPLMSAFLVRADAIVATSPNYLRTSSTLQRHLNKTTTIPIGIGDAATPDPSLVDRWRGEVGIDFFLFVGALRYYKGLAYLVEAARKSELPVVIAGAGEYSAQIAAANLPNIRMVGEINEGDKEALLQLCRGFVFPSHLRSEAFGVALLEAARAGRPLISCEIGTGTTFVNIHEETGLVIPPANSDALSKAMLNLASNSTRASVMGNNARKRYEAVFTRHRMAEAYHNLYTSLTLSPRS